MCRSSQVVTGMSSTAATSAIRAGAIVHPSGPTQFDSDLQLPGQPDDSVRSEQPFSPAAGESGERPSPLQVQDPVEEMELNR